MRAPHRLFMIARARGRGRPRDGRVAVRLVVARTGSSASPTDKGFLDKGGLHAVQEELADPRLRVPGRRGRAPRHRRRGLRRHARRVRASATALALRSCAGGEHAIGALCNHALELTGLAGDPASPVHRLDPRAKVVGLVGVTLVAVSTPLAAWPVFVACAAVLGGVAARGARARRARSGAARASCCRSSCSSRSSCRSCARAARPTSSAR